MNVADLLQDTPSDRRRQPQQREQQPPPPQHREPSRERPPSRQQQHQQPPQLPPYPPQQSSRNARPLSPPPREREYPREYAPNHPPSQRLPSMMDFPEPMDKHRRAHEPLPPPHMSQEMALRQQQHGPPPSMGGPGQHGYSDHRLPSGPPPSRSQPPSQSHPHSHHHGHSHPHSSHSSHSSASPMYPPPPSSRNALPPSKLVSTPPGPGMPPPTGHGSIPLYPTPVGPGVVPPLESHRDPRGAPNFSEQSPMYSGPPSSLNRLPPPPSHLGHPHDPHVSSRHRTNSSSGRASQVSSPVMHSLQRQAYDERDGPRGPPMGPPAHYGGAIGPGTTSSGARGDHRPPSNMNARGPPMLTGPGAGIHGEPLSMKERERMEWEAAARERDRDRQREREMEDERMFKQQQRQREIDERRAQDRERERRVVREERAREERAREREMREGHHDLMSNMLRDDRMAVDREREREHLRRASAKEQLEGPPYGAYTQPRYPDARRIEIEEREMAIAQEEEMRRAARDRDTRFEIQRAQQEMVRQAQMERSGREREAKAKERSGEMDRVLRKERTRESRRVPEEQHGWLPEPRPRSPEWPEKLDREWERRERMAQREREAREREEMDARRGPPAHPHHHHLHVHHPHRHPSQHGTPNPPPQATSKSRQSSRLPDPGEFVPPGALPAPFSSVINERPHKHKTPVGPPVGQPSMPQHLHPSHATHIHPHGHPSPMGFPHPSSPQPMSALIAPGILENALPKTPRPHLLPKLTPLHIGTFVYPRIPFPFLDFPLQPSETTTSPTTSVTTAGETREIHLTIYVPTGFLPSTRPKRPRIWGGALVPNFSPLFPAPQRISHLQGGMPYGNPRPHPLEMYGTRRVYTDDSDLFLCALHAGWVSWSATRQARREGKDLRLELRLSKEARFVGGPGARFVGIPEGQDGVNDDDGRALLSAGWGNGHDGSGMEILKAEFVKKGVAHKFSIRNRDQRLLEYSERSATLGCMSRVRKRRRVDAMFYDDCEDVTLPPSSEADLVAARTVVFGCRQGLSKAGFKYLPEAVKSALFSTSEDRVRPRKKARLSDSNGVQMDIDGEPTKSIADASFTDGSIIVETLVETFLIAPQDCPGAVEKENAVNSFDDYLSARRYTVSLVRTSIPEAAEDSEPTAKADAPEAPASKVAEEPKDDEPHKPVPDQVTNASATAEAMVVEPKAEAAEKPKDVQQVATEASSEPGKTADTEASVAAVSDPATTHSPAEAKKAEDEKAEAPAPHPAEESSTNPPTGTPALVPSDASSSAPAPTDAPPSTASPAPMDVEPSKPTETMPVVLKAQPAQPVPVEAVPAKTTVAKPVSPKRITTIEVLQRNLTEDDMLFDSDGISILSRDVENGMRKGWKIEARSWRWATDTLTAA